ncbi:uncharacterized protein LOC143854297 [Tasmannia lanceolata]|uniref:uncharacterized protein LOC143854297 n=1 Tax=Tasmannia lanceolata TaxID=3420 RepID=UPI0040640441
MSDRISLEKVSSNAKPRESMHPHQAQWMSHRMRASCNPVSRFHECHSIHDVRKEVHNTIQGKTSVQISESRKRKRLGVHVDLSLISECRNTWNHGQGTLEVASNFPQSSKEVVTGTRRIKITDEVPMRNSKNIISPDAEPAQLDSLSFCRLLGSSVNKEHLSTPFPYLRNTILEQNPIQKFKFSKKMENISSPVTDVSIFNNLPSMYQFEGKSGYEPHLPSKVFPLPPNEIGVGSKESHFQAGVAQSQGQPTEHYKLLEENSLPVSKPFPGSSKGPTPNSVLYGVKSKGPNTRSCTCREEENHQSSSRLAFKEHCVNTHVTHMECVHSKYCSYSTILASDVKIDNRINAKCTGGPSAGQNDEAPQLSNDALDGDLHLPILVEGQDGRINDFTATRFLPHKSITPLLTPLENLKSGQHLLKKMPTCSLHGVETLRICTTVDSEEGMPGGPSKFSKTTHHLTIAKKTDGIFSKGEPMIKESTVSAEYKGDTFRNMLSMPPFFGFYDEPGTSFQPLRNLIDSEEKEDEHAHRAGFLRIQNESSAETDSMPIDVYQSRNSLAGLTLCPSQKDVMVSKNTGYSPAAVASSSKETRINNAKTKLPDINEEPPANSVVGSPENKNESSTSRTKSLDVEHLLTHVEQPVNPYSSPQQDTSIGIGPELSNRWVKRLRLNAPSSLAVGTKSLKVGDASSSRQVNELFSKIMNYSKSNSEPTLCKHLEKETQNLDKPVILLRNRNSSELESPKDRQDLMLYHSWIRRWCCNREVASQERGAAQVGCEPETSNAALEEYQRKQFPSIAGMALLGKEVSNFRTCEFRKRGSYVVWST